MGLFQRRSEQQPEDKLQVVDESLRQETEWKPTTHQLMIMVALSVISFMVSLDACIIVTSLSVRETPPFPGPKTQPPVAHFPTESRLSYLC